MAAGAGIVMDLRLRDLVRATGGARLAGDPNRLCRRVSTDTRTLRRGDWFVALTGENFDGHRFVDVALERGAAGLVLSRVPTGLTTRRPLLLVNDTLTALGAIAAAWRRRLGVKVITVTGSSGKTTTKDMLGRLVRRLGPTLVTEGNLNNRIGVPLQLQRLTRRHRWAVLEIGMNMPGEIDLLGAMTRPRIGVITNVGEAHVGMFKTGRRGVLEAKAELLRHITRGGIAVLNADDESTPRLASRARRRGLRVVRFSGESNRRADLWVARCEPRPQLGHRVVLTDGAEEVAVSLPIFGHHNVANLAAAAAAARGAGVRLRDFPRALAGFQPTAMRSSVRTLRGVTLIEDCYNANPLSVAAALESLGAMPCAGRRVAVLGDMFELGRRSRALHAGLGKAVLAAGIDRLVTFGDAARHIATRASGVPARHFRDPEACARHLHRALRRGDAVLIKGSRGMAMERIIRALEEMR